MCNNDLVFSNKYVTELDIIYFNGTLQRTGTAKL